MDNRPIGVFDSGLGGLTAVRELMDLLPNESIVYLGDTGRVPYGTRSKETILKYARQDINFLNTFDLKAILIACGTITTNGLDMIQKEYPLPILGVAEPAARAAAAATRNGRIGLIATQASIRSGLYERIIRAESPQTEIFSVPCPLFVSLVEAGHYAKGDPMVKLAAEEYLTSLQEQKIDTLILGCTHYPLLSDAIEDFFGPAVTLINSGAQGALTFREMLAQKDLLADPQQVSATYQYYVTDRTEQFSRLAAVFLGRPVSGLVEQVVIDQ
ncbi:MAG: glutamate racemase [Oscillospiraceae bacterium]|nr:glutamate racemase [Oscillospiraceae bacterium]